MKKNMFLKVNVDTFLENEEEYGIYEYDGFSEEENTVIIQINVEEGDGNTISSFVIYKIVESKLEKYLKDTDMI